IPLVASFTMRGSAIFHDGLARYWYIVNDATKGILNDATYLFDQAGSDVVSCEGGSNVQAFSVITKAFSFDNPLTLKYFKQVLTEYRNASDTSMDILMNLNPSATNTKT